MYPKESTSTKVQTLHNMCFANCLLNFLKCCSTLDFVNFKSICDHTRDLRKETVVPYTSTCIKSEVLSTNFVSVHKKFIYSTIQHISQSVSGQFLIAKIQLYKSLCVSVAKLKIFPEVSHGYPRLLIQSCHTSLHFRKKAPFGLS